MYGSYNSKEEVTSAFSKGELDLFGLERIADRNPEYVSNDLLVAAYNGFIKENHDECVKDFDKCDFDAGMHGIINMDSAIKDAMRLGYTIDTTPFKNIIERAYDSARHDFKDSLSLFRLLEKSPLDCDTCKNNLQNNVLPELAEAYAEVIFKTAKKVAKRFKRTEKYPKYANNLPRNFEKLEEIMTYGIKPEEKIREIIAIAFNKGVEFYLKKAETIQPINPERANYLRNVAKRNAELLEMNLS